MESKLFVAQWRPAAVHVYSPNLRRLTTISCEQLGMEERVELYGLHCRNVVHLCVGNSTFIRALRAYRVSPSSLQVYWVDLVSSNPLSSYSCQIRLILLLLGHTWSKTFANNVEKNYWSLKGVTTRLSLPFNKLINIRMTSMNIDE